ncbi:major tail protein [Jeotgalibacillus salarius]|uniref:Phage tail protein n=1 Tax=Jeotgalibacillus salarius TaxID=546023 RepID=A0A4Y8LPL6_9BACL|nr:major tail protein [Jeotgalibacillus salarius]TFE02887.1 phage tail protein [Jeotgalibacillus salarius]
MYTGLDNFHYAILTDDPKGGPTVYDTPVALKGAMSFNETPTTNMATLYSDNGPSATASSNGPTTVEIGIAALSLEDRAALLGQKINSDGALVQSRNDRAPYVAFGCRLTGEDEDDAYIWLYKGKFSRPTQTNNTKGESPEFQTPTISATFIGRDSDGHEKIHIVQDDSNQAVIDAWFDAVSEETPTP